MLPSFNSSDPTAVHWNFDKALPRLQSIRVCLCSNDAWLPLSYSFQDFQVPMPFGRGQTKLCVLKMRCTGCGFTGEHLIPLSEQYWQRWGFTHGQTIYVSDRDDFLRRVQGD